MSTKELTVLTPPETLPADFFTSKTYDKVLDNAVAETSNLVYSLDEAGEKAAKADATAINKFAKAFDGFIATTFKAQTSEITAWRDDKKNKTKQLLANRQQLIDQFAEMRTQKLAEIRALLINELAHQWNEKGVKTLFQDDAGLEELVKLSAITPKGSITAKTQREIESIANANHAWQSVIDSRAIEIENRCLKAGINPPFTSTHLGSDFYAKDNAVFDKSLDCVIDSELQRKAEMEARIIREQEAKKQAEIDAAVAKAEADARAKAEAEAKKQQAEKASLVTENETKAVLVDEPVKQEPAPALKPAPKPVNGKHAVDINFTLRVQISDRISDETVLDHFKKQLPEKLLEAVIHAEAKSCH